MDILLGGSAVAPRSRNRHVATSFFTFLSFAIDYLAWSTVRVSDGA
jgi:hypothetical protein